MKAVLTTRAGGCSSAPWDSLNLGDHVGDVPEHVLANRAMLQKTTGAQAVFLKQVHGTGVELISSTTPNGTAADACVTTQRGLACTIMVADCLPVLLTNTDGSAVAAAHAGWRGLAGTDSTGVLEAVVNAFQASNKPFDSSIPGRDAPEIIAWLGPCIGPTAFEVGGEVKAAFEAGQTDAARFFAATGNGKFLADLAGLAKARLTALGIAQIDGNDSTADWCTVANRSRFFSHRRDAGVTGRMAACIWLA